LTCALIKPITNGWIKARKVIQQKSSFLNACIRPSVNSACGSRTGLVGSLHPLRTVPAPVALGIRRSKARVHAAPVALGIRRSEARAHGIRRGAARVRGIRLGAARGRAQDGGARGRAQDGEARGRAQGGGARGILRALERDSPSLNN
jgi:hypothetical protein